MTRDENDLKLIKIINTGDKINVNLAWGELYQSYYSKLKRYINLKSNFSKERNDEIINIVFEKVFRKLSLFDMNQSKFTTWIHTITKNTIVDSVRRSNQLENISFSWDGAVMVNSDNYNTFGLLPSIQIESNEPTPFDSLVTKESHQYLHELLNSFPLSQERYKKVLMLRYFKEYSYEEMVQELKIPIGTIKGQLHRAKELLLKFKKAKEYSLY